MTFRQIIDDAAERVGNLQPEARVRFRRYLNEWYHRILAEVNLPRGSSTTLAVVAGTADYTLASAVGRVRQIYDATNNHVLHEQSLQWIREADPLGTLRGIPTFYAYVTDRKIKLHPIPSANATLQLDTDVTLTDLDDDADVPVIPEDFHWLLSLGIRINEHEKNDDATRLRYARQDMADGVARLRFWLAGRAANRLNPGRWSDAGIPSRLGGWYPRNT